MTIVVSDPAVKVPARGALGQTVRMDSRTAAAVIDNARWCDLVCSTHGIGGRFDADAWISPRRTPPMYPDAVTLRPDVSVEALLARIDPSAGCSIKDSFASLDLAAEGFRVLFDATWMYRPAGPPPDRSPWRWERVVRPEELRGWSDDHGGGPTFTPALLEASGVTILSGRDPEGRRRAGAIATEGEAAVGISNVFAIDEHGDRGSADACSAAFAAATTAIVDRFPDRPLVGYETGLALDAALALGFEAAGPLRVWLRDAP